MPGYLAQVEQQAEQQQQQQRAGQVPPHLEEPQQPPHLHLTDQRSKVKAGVGMSPSGSSFLEHFLGMS